MWDELGIAPSADPKVIRRAYAVRLKALDPDREPAAFARLRDAYERALEASPTGATELSAPASAANGADTSAEPARTAAAERAAPAEEPSAYQRLSPNDQEDIRDRALLLALDAALRDGNAAEAIALYYRAAATGALPLAGTTDLGGRLLAVALDDTKLDPAAFRHLLRIIGVDASRTRAPVNPELRRRAFARLAADDWYEELLAKAAGRARGKAARAQRKIALLLLGRIGRYVNPDIDPIALRSWLTQYYAHATWLSARIDPRWIARLEGRLRRKQAFVLIFWILFFGGLLLDSVVTTIVGVTDSDPAALVIGPILGVFSLWILLLGVKQLLKLLWPGRDYLRLVGGPREIASHFRAAWRRLIAKHHSPG